MNEILREGSETDTRIRIIEFENQRLTTAVRTLGLITEEVLRVEDLPEYTVLAVESRVGRAIRELIQTHLSTFLVDETSIRGAGVDIGVGRSNLVLDIDDGQLYNVSRSQRTMNHVAPRPDYEWVRSCKEIIGAVTCIRYY